MKWGVGWGQIDSVFGDQGGDWGLLGTKGARSRAKRKFKQLEVEVGGGCGLKGGLVKGRPGGSCGAKKQEQEVDRWGGLNKEIFFFF